MASGWDINLLLMQVLLPHLDLLEKQHAEVCNLKQSCQQTEDALSQGMEKLQQTLSDALAAGQLGEGSYFPQVANAMERLDALVSFVGQVMPFFLFIRHPMLLLFLCPFCF